jgi:hypothetical protein
MIMRLTLMMMVLALLGPPQREERKQVEAVLNTGGRP